MKNWKEWPYSTYDMQVERVWEPLEIDVISKEAKRRLQWFDFYRNNNGNIRLTCRHFGIHHSTFYYWKKRYNPDNLKSLENYSRRPKKVRQPEIPLPIVLLVEKLRKQYPSWSKYKLEAILRKKHRVEISASSIGRILKRKGLIDKKTSREHKKASQNPKLRARGTRYQYPGSHVEIDTKHILGEGFKLYQFTAIDSVTRQRILRVYPRITSRQGKEFLVEVIKKFPFRVKNVQTDNGSEFLGDFQQACHKLGITHYFAYPRSPKQNALVERSHRTDEDEFYMQGNIGDSLEEQRELMREWERIYNNERPHQALNYLTPNEYFGKIKKRKVSGMC